jgi:hypothetical protein
LYLLTTSRGKEIKSEILSGRDQMFTLFENTYRGFVLQGLGGLETHFDQCRRLLKHTYFKKVELSQNINTKGQLADYFYQDITNHLKYEEKTES